MRKASLWIKLTRLRSRPQYDGPGLRVVAVTTYANELLKRGQSLSFVREIYDSVKIDLDFISDNWNKVRDRAMVLFSIITTPAPRRSLRISGKRLGRTASSQPLPSIELSARVLD